MAEFTKPKKFTNLKAISSLDGRFRGNVEYYSEYFSEYATMKMRVEIEIRYLIAIIEYLNKGKLKKKETESLLNIFNNFSERDAKWIEKKDLDINHDTKAVEYFVRKKLKDLKMKDLTTFVHIGLTSSDIDCNSLVLCIKKFEKEIFSILRESLLSSLKNFARKNKNSVFLAKTHGKHAVPTTMAKEITNFIYRLEKIDKKISNHKFEGKITGAVGNFNALYSAYSKKNWKKFTSDFFKSLNLIPNTYTTQILPYDNMIEYLNLVSQFNNILIDLARDCWTYVSRGYLGLKIVQKEVGSSTMPHKVNPISFEGAESYLLLSSNSISFFNKELSTNRLQRDLTDKYITREIGVSLVQAGLGYSMILGGIKNIVFKRELAKKELNGHWEILGEGIQTILRREGKENAYEVIKKETRGKNLNEEEYMKMIESMKGISKEIKEELKNLKPEEYIGWAKDIIQ